MEALKSLRKKSSKSVACKDFEKVISEMLSEAVKTQKEVSTNIGYILFVVKPSYSLSDAISLFIDSYVAFDSELKLRENKEVDLLIKDENFECFDKYEDDKICAENSCKSKVMHYANRWARLMQVEIKSSAKLTKENVAEASFLADDNCISFSDYGKAKILLLLKWKNREQFRLVLDDSM